MEILTKNTENNIKKIIDHDTKLTLIKNLKRQVKQIMEEAVTKKFVHEDSMTVLLLCSSVEACLSDRIKRRALGLFKSSSTLALLHKIGKFSKEANIISKMVLDFESNSSGKFSSNDSLGKHKLNGHKSADIGQIRYLWIRLALSNKLLTKIIDFLVENNSKFYEKDALLSDPDYGPIISSLLVGPCALEYSKLKVQDNYWSDPPAGELVQRHRISSGYFSSNSSQSSAYLKKFACRIPVGNLEDSKSSLSARDYVESLHQNNKAKLLYGKNHVLVQPKPDTGFLHGYLSLHQYNKSLILKWTPNYLMDRGSDSIDFLENKTIYWQYSLNLSVEDIVYLHCHHQADEGDSVVLVGQDGVQRPPLTFPPGGHLITFLSCLETGLLPNGWLDPPLRSQQVKDLLMIKPYRHEDTNKSHDLVFRILYHFRIHQTESSPLFSLMKSKPDSFSSNSNHINDSYTLVQTSVDTSSPSESSLNQVCDVMRQQILSRAFCGWMAHCRHLRTVRTHLISLVHPKVVSELTDNWNGITSEVWKELHSDDSLVKEHELYYNVYVGGILDPSLRKEIWPYLLKYYQIGITTEQRKLIDEHVRSHYENTMSEWMAAEAIIMSREKNSLLNKRYSSSNSDIPGIQESQLSNEVFEELLFQSDEETLENSHDQIELLESFSLNLHRIDKDVQRCDRNYHYFIPSNLEKLRNIMCTYVWENLEIGYMQGMCDLLAPLLVIFDDEAKSYYCFCKQMERLIANFPHGGAMDANFANMRSLIQILDNEMFELMHQSGDYIHFYFCYRWFLLDFKREFVYEDVFAVWECIWAAEKVASNHFILFIALALVQYYRNIILDNNMEFTDIIKFFNEMAEHHDVKVILKMARELVLQLQILLENK